jgi:tetratricopeptide (TPR) repeat protein
MIFGYCSSLYKVKDYKSLIDVYRTAQVDQIHTDSVKGIFAWALYYHYIKLSKYDQAEQLINVIDEIAILSPQVKGLNALALSVISILRNGKLLSPQLRVVVGEKISPELLERTPAPAKDPSQTYPSQLEEYYIGYSKALEEAEEYSKAVDVCNKALNLGIRYHYSQDLWMRRRMATCLVALQHYDKALEQMQIVNKIKRDWFVLHELAEIFYLLNSLSNALSFAEKAATAFGKVEMKIKLWGLLQKIYAKLGKSENSSLMLRLQLAICVQMKWHISQQLSSAAAEFHLEASKLPPFAEIYAGYAASIKGNNTPPDAAKPGKPLPKPATPTSRISGTIKKLLPHGRSGFIRSSIGDLFFSVQDINNPDAGIEVGKAVTCKVIESFDPGKNAPTFKARAIHIE